MKKFNIVGHKISFNNILISVLSIFFIFSLVGPIVALAAGPAPVDLLSAGNFVILSKTGISTTGNTSVVGDIGVSPAAATYITGFDLTLPTDSAFSTSPLVVGKIYAPDYANPTPSNISIAVGDMQTAYTDASGRTNPTATELGAGNIGGMTLAPGLYKWETGLAIPTDVTLSGEPNDVWIFQVAQNLNLSSGVKIILTNGAQSSNIFWVVAGQTTIGTTAVFNGNILDKTAIVLNTGAKLNGRALAQTAVTLDANTITTPTSRIVIPIPVPPVCNQNWQCSCGHPIDKNNCGFLFTGQMICPQICISPTSTTIVPIISTSTQKIIPNYFNQEVKAITNSFTKGYYGNNVKILQQFLISQNKGPFAEDLAKAGSTNYFGSLTKASLAEFQAKVGISPALGNFGSTTRAYLKANY